MADVKVIRYTTKPERADENEALVRGVFEELAANDPGGLRYATFRLNDGVSFVHVAFVDGERNPLDDSTAFQAFTAAIADRVAEGPVVRDATVVGSYGGILG
jgi:quinol monooxygenase YgiN